MSYRAISSQEEAKIQAKIRTGQSPYNIAKELGVSHSLVCRVQRDMGMKVNIARLLKYKPRLRRKPESSNGAIPLQVKFCYACGARQPNAIV